MWQLALSVGRAAMPYIGRALPWALLGFNWADVEDENKKPEEEQSGVSKAMAGLLGAGLVLGIIGIIAVRAQIGTARTRRR